MSEHHSYEKMGKLLWRIMPDEVELIYCVGRIYPEFHQLGPEWVKKDSSIGRFGFDDYPDEWCDEFFSVVSSLQKLSMSSKDNWTHFKASLTEKGKFKIEFAYIPEDDSWPGLFMKGVSDLTEEEAKALYIPEQDWLERVKKYKNQ